MSNVAHNYRQILKERYGLLKATVPTFSARNFAKKAGFSSSSYFHMVVSGQRNLTETSAKKISQALKLSSGESKYILKCVAYERSKSPQERLEIAAQLTRLQPSESKRMDHNHLLILSDPVNVKLYLLAQSTKFKINIIWISKHFEPIQMESLPSRVKLLISSGLWQLNDGKVKKISPVLKTNDCIVNENLRLFHLALIDLAKKSVIKQTAEKRIVGARSFLINPKRMPEIAAHISDFKDMLEEKFEDLTSEEVYSIQIAFFAI